MVRAGLAIAIVIIITTCRLMVRSLHRGLRFGADDWAIIPGAVGTVTLADHGTGTAPPQKKQKSKNKKPDRFYLADVHRLSGVGLCPGPGQLPRQASLPMHLSRFGSAGEGMNASWKADDGLYRWTSAYAETSLHANLDRLQFTAIKEPLFWLSVGSIKISIVFFNRRLTGLTSRPWQIAHWTLLGIILCFVTIAIFLSTLQCSPPAVHFSLMAVARTNPRQIKCLDARNFSLATRSMHIATDFVLLCVPIMVLYRLQMPLWRKLRLCVLFCFGAVSCAASVVRNVLIQKKTVDLTCKWAHTIGPWENACVLKCMRAGDYVDIFAWNNVDVTFAAIVASLPTLNVLIEAGLRKAHGFHQGSNLFSWSLADRKSFSSHNRSTRSDRKAMNSSADEAHKSASIPESRIVPIGGRRRQLDVEMDDDYPLQTHVDGPMWSGTSPSASPSWA